MYKLFQGDNLFIFSSDQIVNDCINIINMIDIIFAWKTKPEWLLTSVIPE